MSKHLRAFRVGANVIGFRKNDINYAMTCAWSMMISYDKIAMLIGEQSITGKNLEVGLKVGVSALADGQQEIAKKIGNFHSNEVDKLQNIEFINKENRILIKNAKVMMECTVDQIQNIDGDLLVFLNVNDFNENENVDFLDGYDKSCY